jgi:hypothetical protein
MQIFDPASWEVTRARRLVIADGRVNCPVRGSVDVETCFACRALVTIMGDGEPAYVSCRPTVRAQLPAGA